MTERTDEETLELIKGWWDENGTSLLVTLAVVVAGIFGWRGYQDAQVADQAAAANAWAEFQTVATALEGDDAEQAATARHLADTLKDEYAGTGYAAYAAFSLARAAVEQDDLATAEAELRHVIDGSFDDTLKDLARVRLARVLAAGEDSDGALAVLDAVTAAGYVPEAQELRGDILVARGDFAAARTAYSDALAASEALEGGAVNTALLRMKLDDLGANS